MTIEELREKGWIAYEYIRGSHMYGLNTENSDKDIGGVFICPYNDVVGLRSKYIEQVSDEKHDTVYYEFGRWIELLMKANPTALEGLYAPKRCIIGKVHPVVQYIIDHRDMFLSKECFKTLTGYAFSQISKAKGLNKKINWDKEKVTRKGILDFCYTFRFQGSEHITDFLESHGLKQEYCGLVNVPNMKGAYSVFYDWGNHILHEGMTTKFYNTLTEWYYNNHKNLIGTRSYIRLKKNSEDIMEHFKPIGYRGIVARDYDEHESHEVRLSSIEIKDYPICYMFYNEDGYISHCREYKEYKTWEKERNPVRYESNLNQSYDGKNLSHCMRLTRMGKELALGQGFNVERTWDREYLLSIKNHELEYKDVMAQAEKERNEMEEAVKTCTLPDKIDEDKINELLINARNILYKKNKESFIHKIMSIFKK